MRIRCLLSMYAALILRTFALPYGRHRLPLTVSQRSLCNILSSLNGARYAVQSPRKDYPRMCFTRSGQRPAPGVGNVRREWEGCAEKRGKRERERNTRRNAVPQILRLPPLAPFLPRWMHSSLCGAARRKRAYTLAVSRRYIACSIQCACTTSARRCIIQ